MAHQVDDAGPGIRSLDAQAQSSQVTAARSIAPGGTMGELIRRTDFSASSAGSVS